MNRERKKEEEKEAAHGDRLEMAVVQELDYFSFTSSASAVKSGVVRELPWWNSWFSPCFSCFGSC